MGQKYRSNELQESKNHIDLLLDRPSMSTDSLDYNFFTNLL